MPTTIQIDAAAEKSRVDLNRFAQIVIEKWEFNVAKRKLISSGDLLRSFQYTVSGEANGDKAAISFTFNYYLRMLEMGVAKYSPIGSDNKRRKHKIFTKTFNAEVHRLAELYANQYAAFAAAGIAGRIQGK